MAVNEMETAKAIVLKKFPDAECIQENDHYRIIVQRQLGAGNTDAAAWIDTATMIAADAL